MAERAPRGKPAEVAHTPFAGPTPVAQPKKDSRMAKEMLVNVSQKISVNITIHGYREDKIALGILNNAIELL